MNQTKTFFLMVFLTIILVALGSIVGGSSGAYIAFFIALIMNLVSYWFSDKIVLAMYHAKPVSENEAPHLYSIVYNLSQKASIPMPKVYIIENDSPNAFATGRNPSNGVVAVTTGILRILSKDELEGVIAHEISHIKHRDILIQTISRSREYLADEGGARLSGNPLHLSGALKKLSAGIALNPMNDANPSTAPLFIANPFSAKGVMTLFSTHPPMEERIKRLEDMAYRR